MAYLVASITATASYEISIMVNSLGSVDETIAVMGRTKNKEVLVLLYTARIPCIFYR